MKRVVLLILVFAVFACKDGNKKNSPIAKAPVKVQKPEVKLYTFDGGTVLANKLELFSQDTTYQGQSKEFADAFYVISHPNGNLMWDAGLPESLVSNTEPFTTPNGNFTISRKETLLDQLQTIGLTPLDFKYIALSHTHFDHTGHANLLKNATWLVQESEYDFVTSDAIKENNSDIYMAISELSNVQKLNGDFDVFGDGTVIIKSMPGHSPGHQVLYLNLEEHGPLLLTGDLYHTYENRTYKRIPIFNTDPILTKESMTNFEAFAKTKKAKVYIQHQKEDFNKMPKAPNYLK